MLLDELIAGTRKHVRKRLWVISDLQQKYPDRATKCMTTAVSDFLELGLSVDAVCYLGDATEGDDPEYIRQMTEMQQRELSKIDAPIYYTVGNHDFDYFRKYHDQLGRMCIPFVEYVRQYPQWHLPEKISDMAYHADLGDFEAYFLTDHADPEGKWFTSHGGVRGSEADYPYTPDDYRRVMEEIAKAEGLEASEADLDKEFEDMASQYGMDKEKVKSYADEAQLEEMKSNIAVRKAVDLLFESAK